MRSSKNDKLWYSSPALAWEESLPIGNGSMGAMIYGDPVNETISINEDTLWSGTPKDKNNKNAAKYLPEIRRLMKEGKRIEAEEIINRYTLGDMCETYLPFCDIFVKRDSGKITNYYRELDISRGVFLMECDVDGKRISEEAFASYPDKLIDIRFLSSDGESLKICVSSKLKYTTVYNDNTIEIYGIAPESNLPTVRGITPPTIYGDEKTSKAIRFYSMMTITTDGVCTPSDDGLSIVGSHKTELRLSPATSFISPFVVPSADARARSKNNINASKHLDHTELLSRHIADFSSLYSRFDIKLGNGAPDLPTNERLLRASRGEDDADLAALLVKYGRYLMISSSRPGSRATNLQGIWNEKLHPQWCSNYTININTEMNYWGAEPTGLGECTEPLINYISELSKSGSKTAMLHYGCRGWVAHSSSDVWAYSSTCGPVNERRGCSRYATWQGASGWLCRHLYDRYLYSNDKNELSRVYPMMLGAARFYLDFMYEDENGHLVTSPSLSPENIYHCGDMVASVDIMPSMDKAIITELFSSCISAANVLGDDSDIIDEMRTALKKIEPIKIGKNGGICEWSEDFDEAEPNHRHVSHLYALYPSHMINDSTPHLQRAAGITLKKRMAQGTGWGIMWKTCLYARLSLGEDAYSMFRLIFNRLPYDAPMGNTGGGLYDNLFDACPPFQIDGNFGAIAAVCEMIICDNGDGTADLRPSLPKAFSTGEIRGYRLLGGKSLDIKWQNGNVVEKCIR